MKEKVVLAYSGGLDTTAIIPWLKETFNYDVICCCIDCGQGEELDGLEERAKLSGAAKLNLTNNDMKICAYVKLGMSTKEIAELMNIEISSAESARYRLRKNMGLAQSDSLTEIVSKI